VEDSPIKRRPRKGKRRLHVSPAALEAWRANQAALDPAKSTPARDLVRSMPKRGLPKRSIQAVDFVMYKLGTINKSYPKLLEACFEAQRGSMASLEYETAKRLAAQMILRDTIAAKIMKQGVATSEIVRDQNGKLVGRRIIVHPLLAHLSRLDEQLGITMEQARLSKRSRGQGARDDAITEALTRDARIRAAKNLQLPAADPSILKEEEEEEEKPIDTDPIDA